MEREYSILSKTDVENLLCIISDNAIIIDEIGSSYKKSPEKDEQYNHYIEGKHAGTVNREFIVNLLTNSEFLVIDDE